MAKIFKNLLLFSLAVSMVALANAQQLIQGSQISVLGVLECTADGNALQGATSTGIPGVQVNITCNGGQLSLGTLVTDVLGTFTGLLPIPTGVPIAASSCAAQVQLPIANCTLLPDTGILQSVLQVPATGGLIGTVLGLVQTLLAAPWTLIAV